MTIKLSDQQLEVLRTEYSKLLRVDPDSPTFQRLVKFLDDAPESLLVQLAGASIPWLSNLAKLRVRSKGSVV